MALEEVEAPDVAVGEAGDEGAADAGGTVGRQDGRVVGVQDLVALEAAQQRRPDAQQRALPGGRRARAVDDAVQHCGRHERAVEEGCVVAHGGYGRLCWLSVWKRM